MALTLAIERVSFNAFWTAVVPAENAEGDLILVYITRRYVEDTWNMSFNESAVRRKIVDHEVELTALAAKAQARGERDLVLDNLSQTSWTNVPVA